jgi:Flavoprotein
MLVFMARKNGVLSVVVSGAAPAADVGSLVKQALERGWTVQVIATPSALAFFDAAEIEELTGSAVRSQHRAPGTPRSRVPDAIVVAPATFNLLNQWALGVADSYALAVLAEQTGMGLPIVVLPAVSPPLASRPQFARSLKALRGEGVSVLLGPGGTAPPGATEDSFPWNLALDEAFSMTGIGGLRSRPLTRAGRGRDWPGAPAAGTAPAAGLGNRPGKNPVPCRIGRCGVRGADVGGR